MNTHQHFCRRQVEFLYDLQRQNIPICPRINHSKKKATVKRPGDTLVILTGTIGLVTPSSTTSVFIAEVAATHVFWFPCSIGAGVEAVDELFGGDGTMVKAAAAAVAAAVSAAGSGVMKGRPSPPPPTTFPLNC